MASFGVAGVRVGDDEIVVAGGPLPGHRPDDRARCVVGELPAGDGRRRRRAGPGPRPAPRRRPRATSRSPTSSARWGAPSTTTPTGSSCHARPGRAAHRHRRRHGRRLRPRADARRRRRRGDDADDDHRRRVHPGQGERPPRRPRRRAAARSGPTSPSSPTGCASSRPARCTAPSSAPTTTTAWRWRSACSAPSSPASWWPTPTSCRRAGRGTGRLASASSSAVTGAGRPPVDLPPWPPCRQPATPRPVVAAFDVDGTVTIGDCVVPFLRRVAGTPRIAGGLLAPARPGRRRARPPRPRPAQGAGVARRVRRPPDRRRRAAGAAFAADVAGAAPAAGHARPGWRGTATPGTRRCSSRRRTACTCARWPPASASTASWRRSSTSPPTAGAPGRSSTATAAGRRRSPACTPGSTSTAVAGRPSSCGRTATRTGDRELLADADHAEWAKDVVLGGRRPSGAAVTASSAGSSAPARPRQWLKNVLVFAAPGAAGVLDQWDDLWRTLLAFVAFCLGASAIYLWNDALDVEADRAPPDEAPAPGRRRDRARPHGQGRRLAAADRRPRRRRADRALADRRRRRRRTSSC